MRIAVTDACIFIDLLELGIISEFFDLDIEIHTTIEVWNEVNLEQQTILKAYRSVKKLAVHILEPEDLKELNQHKFPKSLSEPDKSVIYIAQKLGALLLSSDGPVRKYAEAIAIEKHGLFWILDEMVKQQVITKANAVIKLTQLTNKNLMYLGNQKLQKEINQRLAEWG